MARLTPVLCEKGIVRADPKSDPKSSQNRVDSDHQRRVELDLAGDRRASPNPSNKVSRVGGLPAGDLDRDRSGLLAETLTR